MLLLVITFTVKLLVTVCSTNLYTKSYKKTIGMELNNKFVTDMTKTEQHFHHFFYFWESKCFSIKLSLCILIVY